MRELFAFLGSNRLSGTIPTSMRALTELNYLDLGKLWYILDYAVINLLFSWLFQLGLWEGDNALSGTFPTELGALLALNYLRLSKCLSSFPRASVVVYSRSPSHSFLSCCCVGTNDLDGTVPTELWGLTKLRELRLSKLWNWLDWIGLDWIGLDWIGLDCIGLDCIGLDFAECE
jgi:hypothetical protein